MPEEHTELRVLPHVVPEVLHAELVEVRHDNGPQLAAWHQLLVVGEDLLQEVLVHRLDGGTVQLHYSDRYDDGDDLTCLIEVVIEVPLGPEAREEVPSVKVLGGLLAVESLGCHGYFKG